MPKSHSQINISFPAIRPRRLRKNKYLRDAVRENKTSISDLIMPIFVKEGIMEPEVIESMPGQYRYPLQGLDKILSELLDNDIHLILLFGIPIHKDEYGSEAYNDEGVVQKAVKYIKKEYGDEFVVFTDVCMCQYTSHGHCGIVLEKAGKYIVENDTTLRYISKISVSHAKAGADFVAPSGMMDGMVKSIRSALDEEGFTDVGILSYSAKYSSSFYGPFREAAYSSPKFGDRKGYQMDPGNLREAIKEVILDVEEGADMIMVKPALPYLDVIRVVRDLIPLPVAAYNVSGEYSMVKAASERGWVDERTVIYEIFTSIKRAGADLIISYHSLDFARWVKEGLL